MNKFRFTAIAMLLILFIFGGVTIAKNNETKKDTKTTCNHSNMKQADSQKCDSHKKSCNPSECTPEKMEQCKKQCDMKNMECTPEKMEQCKKQCDMKKKDCSSDKMKKMSGKDSSKCSKMKEKCSKK